MQQQVFTLSWLSGKATVGNLIGPWSTNDLQAQINSLNAPFSNWKVVWGPHYTLDGPFPPQVSNAIFVAQQQDGQGGALPVYVVAVAGTNALSAYDLQTEDLDIDPTEWKRANNAPSQMQVTTGDMDGLTKILGMQWPFNDIRTYLASIQNKGNATLWFTGHSLGGALSPMLMLALMDPDSLLDTKNTNLGLWKQVNLLATAGPSIGNADFLSHFQSVFSASNATTTFVWNAKDVVPHAWNKDRMKALTQPTNIYGLTFPTGSSVGGLIAAQQAAAANQSYVQFEPKAAFEGPLQPYTDSKNTQVPWTPDSEFLAQLGYQHLNAYVSAFGCNWFPQGNPPSGCRWFPLSNPCDDPKSAQQAVKMLTGNSN
jgi:hypothetical protein